jgi:hypothetical protein
VINYGNESDVSFVCCDTSQEKEGGGEEEEEVEEGGGGEEEEKAVFLTQNLKLLGNRSAPN